MKNKIIVAASSVFLCSASFAFAADLPLKAPAPAVALSTWTGAYIGLSGGWGWGNQNDWTIPNTGEGPIPLGGSNRRGGLFGGQAGVNKQIGSWVLGAQVDGYWADIKGSVRNLTGGLDGRCWGGFSDQTADCVTRITAMGNVTGRIGFLPLPDTLLYGKFGVNISRFSYEVNNVIDITGGTCGPVGTNHGGYTKNQETKYGLTAGGGVEQRVWNNVTVFGEYMYVDTGGTSTNQFTGGKDFCTGNFPATTITKGTNTVKFGFNYQFH